MQFPLLATPVGDIVFIFIFCFSIALISAFMAWQGWGVDIHKHLEAAGMAYDEMHPEERAEQERRAAAGPVGPSH